MLSFCGIPRFPRRNHARRRGMTGQFRWESGSSCERDFNAILHRDHDSRTLIGRIAMLGSLARTQSVSSMMSMIRLPGGNDGFEEASSILDDEEA